MTSRRKRDLIERVRYPNPLPELPYPPKLVRIPAPEPNYTTPVFSQRLAESLQLPVAVDADAGMPIDLAQMESLWIGEEAQRAAAATLETPLDWDLVDDEDAFLLSDDVAQAPGTADRAIPVSGIEAAKAQAANVTWLRRTEYLGAEQRKQKTDAKAAGEALDTSRPAQIERIEQGFASANTPLGSLQHPTKPGVHAVDAFELLPDPETWATHFQIVRFTGLLGRGAHGEPIEDPRMDAALLRPVTDPLTGQQRVSMYLTCADTLPQYGDDNNDDEQEPETLDEDTKKLREDRAAERYKKRRRLGVYPVVPWLDGETEGEGDANVYGTGFRHIRDLEPVDQPVATDNLLAVVFDDEKPDPAPELDGVDVNASIAAEAGDDDLFDDDDDKTHGTEDVTTTLPPQSAKERERQHVVTPASQGRHVAYYHRIDMRYGLRIRRTRKAEQRLLVPYEGFLHRIVVGHRPLSEREQAKRLLLREHVDALDMEGVEYVESEEEAEAEAEIDNEADGDAGDAAGGDAHDDDHNSTAEAEADEEEEEQAVEDDEDGDDEDLDIDADELADLQAEADLHPDDEPVGRRRRAETSS
ncbi:Cdc73/Paf1 complex protein [Malassezia pachydermatis]|uniref:Paf1-domain-containing protein n=1 Tax=Malassezia pachydermatis TaxID=77020 RepID=A0A0M8MT41_9BASI|nr:hypothetical protein Malapachy_1942 [Malassezia pachydermatis]KOS13804.1 hypothetical protein Malapachy_1942 [Malassezia pachydermatis]